MSQDPGSEFLRRKWRHFASVLDHDKDGFVSRKDHKELAEHAIEVGGLDPKSTQALQIHKKLMQTFDDLYAPINKGEPVTYDELVKSFSERQEELKSVIHQNKHTFFDMIDSNGDGEIQMDEFRKFFYIFHLNVDEAEKVFQTIDLNHDGVLDRNEFLIFCMKFYFETDESHPSKNLFGFLP